MENVKKKSGGQNSAALPDLLSEALSANRNGR